jgi:hypothetical protein
VAPSREAEALILVLSFDAPPAESRLWRLEPVVVRPNIERLSEMLGNCYL